MAIPIRSAINNVNMKKSLKDQAIDHILSKIDKNTQVYFDKEAFTFYYDPCGQRLHKVEPYYGYGNGKKPVRGLFLVTRVLSFENEIDKGKNGAILGVVDLNKLNFVSLHEDKVVFEIITFAFGK